MSFLRKSEFKKNMGIRKIYEGTALCDVKNAIEYLPFDTPVLNKIRNFLEKHDIRQCLRTGEAYSTSIEDEELYKKPEVRSIAYILKMNLLDTGSSIGYSGFCRLSKECKVECERVAEEIRNLGEELEKEVRTWDAEDMNKRLVWKLFKKWKDQYAWDFTAKEVLASYPYKDYVTSVFEGNPHSEYTPNLEDMKRELSEKFEKLKQE